MGSPRARLTLQNLHFPQVFLLLLVILFLTLLVAALPSPAKARSSRPSPLIASARRTSGEQENGAE
jgi:hypothetical protein